MIKKVIFIVLLLTTIFFNSFAEAQDMSQNEKTVIEVKIDDNKININGIEKEIDNNKNIKVIFNEENGHILIPLRCVAEALGYRVDWNEINNAVILIKNEIILQIEVNKKNSVVKAYKNNNIYTGYLDFYYIDIMHDRTYVSLNFIADILNCDIGWSDENNSIVITDKNQTVGIDFFKEKLNKIYIDEQLKEINETKEKYIDVMKQAKLKDKLPNLIVIFQNDYYNTIFIDIYSSYFPNCKYIIQSEYSGIVSMYFDTIAEAEETVIYLNQWSTVGCAELGYQVYLADE